MLFPARMSRRLRLTSINCNSLPTNNEETYMSSPDTQLSSELRSVGQLLADGGKASPSAGEVPLRLRGALLIAAFAVGLLFGGWLAFYFLLFMRRGYVG